MVLKLGAAYYGNTSIIMAEAEHLEIEFKQHLAEVIETWILKGIIF